MSTYVHFFPLFFKKCKKLDHHIYTYFFIISFLTTFSIIKIVVDVIEKNKNLDYIFLLYCWCH